MVRAYIYIATNTSTGAAFVGGMRTKLSVHSVWPSLVVAMPGDPATWANAEITILEELPKANERVLRARIAHWRSQMGQSIQPSSSAAILPQRAKRAGRHSTRASGRERGTREYREHVLARMLGPLAGQLAGLRELHRACAGDWDKVSEVFVIEGMMRTVESRMDAILDADRRLLNIASPAARR